MTVLLDHEQKQIGYHFAVWNGMNRLGQKVQSGLYVCQFNAGLYSETRKQLLIESYQIME